MGNDCMNSGTFGTIIKVIFPLVIIIVLVISFFLYKKYKENLLDINTFCNYIIVELLSALLLITIPVIIFKVVKITFKDDCNSSTVEKDNNDTTKKDNTNNLAKKEEIMQKIVLLKASLSMADYDSIRTELNKITDDTIKSELSRELESIKNYIDINETIEVLKTNYNLETYYNIYKKILSLDESDIKSKLQNNIVSLKKGTPLNIQSGPSLKKQGSISYYVITPSHPLTGMPLIVAMQPYSCHTSLVQNSKRYTNDEFFLLAPDVGAYNDDMLKDFKKIIDTVVASNQINSNKIIITGHSNGALSTLKLVDFFPDYFSAAVPISSTLPNFRASAYKSTAFWGICGSDESCKTTMAEYANSITSMGGIAKSSVVNGGHSDTGCAFVSKDVLEWVLTQEKK